MGFQDQIKIIKENWLIFVLVLIALLFFNIKMNRFNSELEKQKNQEQEYFSINLENYIQTRMALFEIENLIKENFLNLSIRDYSEKEKTRILEEFNSFKSKRLNELELKNSKIDKFLDSLSNHKINEERFDINLRK